jgi:hypothetical protein
MGSAPRKAAYGPYYVIAGPVGRSWLQTSWSHHQDAFTLISKTGMEAQQTQLDTIAHNLANVGTNGLPRHAVFEDLIPEPVPGRR